MYLLNDVDGAFGVQKAVVRAVLAVRRRLRVPEVNYVVVVLGVVVADLRVVILRAAHV